MRFWSRQRLAIVGLGLTPKAPKAVGYVLPGWAGFFEIGLNAETTARFAGFMVVSIMLAVIFGKVMRER